MHCILHIGTEKTGTSTLQRFFRDNRERLAEQNVCVPTSFGKLEHYHLVSCTLPPQDFFAPLARAGVEGDSARENYCTEVLANFAQEVALLDDDTTVLLTSERCWSNLRSEERIDHLLTMLRSHFDSLSVVVYLRPQHDFCASMYSTALKNGFQTWEILPSDVNAMMPQLDYHDSIQRWAEKVGKDNLQVRIFDQSELLHGDITTDFVVNVLGKDMANFEPVANQNESLSRQAQLFLQHFNKHVPRFEGETFSAKRANIARLLTGLGEGSGIVPTRGDAERFYAQFADSNDAVRAEWFPDREELFRVDFSKYPEQPVDETLTLDEAFEIFGQLWIAKQAEVDKLRIRNRRLTRRIRRRNR